MLKPERWQKKVDNQKGFTIIELLVASVIFSVVLLGATTVIIQIGRMYYKSITSTRTQETSRAVMENISRDLQFSDSKSFRQDYTGSGIPDTQWATTAPTAPTSPNPNNGSPFYVCAGGNRYTYWLGKQVKEGNHGLVIQQAPNGACSSPVAGSGTELLGENMRLTAFSVTRPTASSGTYNVSIGVAYGDFDLLSTFSQTNETIEGNLADTLCLGGIGSNFCATSSLDTVVKRRIE